MYSCMYGYMHLCICVCLQCLQFQQLCNYNSEGANYLDHTLSDHETFK